jgi:FkbM family methyltransferase
MSDKMIFDFGMHKGEDTEFYLGIGARVAAFEANEELVEENRRKFADAIADGRLSIHFGAIVPPTHKGDVVTFYTIPAKSVWGTADSEWVARNAGLGYDVKEFSVPAIRLDEILTEYPRALYTKIDIEGADQIVVDAVRKRESPPEYLSIESAKHSFDALIEEIETLKSLGYTRFAAVQQATIPGKTLSGVGLDGKPFQHTFRNHASGPFGALLGLSLFKSANSVIDDYRRIFEQYRRFGDESTLMKNKLTRLPTRVLNKFSIKLLDSPLCGWYDTHAAM